jgi:hypothetical protein
MVEGRQIDIGDIDGIDPGRNEDRRQQADAGKPVQPLRGFNRQIAL